MSPSWSPPQRTPQGYGVVTTMNENSPATVAPGGRTQLIVSNWALEQGGATVVPYDFLPLASQPARGTSSTHSVAFVKLCATLGCHLKNGPKSEPGNPYYGVALPFTPHVSTYIDWAGCSQCDGDLPYTYNFAKPNTCHDLSLAMVMGDGNASYNPDDHLTVVVTQKGATNQAVGLVFHKVVTKTYTLTGAAFQLHLEVSSGLENFYLISGTATGCSTADGAASA